MAKNKNVDIFIYGVKAFTPVVTNEVYKIMCHNDDDESKFNTSLPILRDYEGENIADKNLMYNEYTGWYWLRMNYPLKDYVGFNHYRRYFDFLDNIPDINQIFKKHSIILNQRFILNYGGQLYNNREYYGIWHNTEDFDTMGKVVKELYPEYADGWDKMAESTFMYPSSIMIMKRNTFVQYMDYIMDVCEEFNDRMNCYSSEDYVQYVKANEGKYIKPQHPYYDYEKQGRMIGYLIERCLQAFLMSKSTNLWKNSYELPWTLHNNLKYND